MNARRTLIWLGLVACGSDVAPVTPGTDQPKSIALTAATTYLVVGATLQLSAEARDSVDAALPDAAITWSVDQPAVATVSSLGSVQAISVGQAKVTATSGAASATVLITVMPVPPEGPAFIVLNRVNDTLTVGDSVSLVATVQTASHVTLPAATVNWRSDNPAAVSVSSDGVVRPIAPGKATISAQSGVATASYAVLSMSALQLSVVGPPPWRGEQPVLVGGSVALIVDVRTVPMGLAVPNAVVRFASYNPSIATVSSSGVVQGVGVGTTMITAASGRARDSLVVTVDMPSLVFAPQGLMVAVGDSVRIKVTAKLPQGDASIDPGLLQWSSAQPQHVRVNAAGWAIGIASPLPGEEDGSSVTGTYSGMQGEFWVHATPYAAGLPAGMRYVHAAGDLGALTFNSSKLAPVQLMPDDVRDVAATSGNFQVGVTGFPVLPPGSSTLFFEEYSSVTDILPPNAHVSLYAAGDSRGALITRVWDNHGPVSGDSVLVRLMYASNFSTTYVGNNLYFLTAGAAIDAHPYSCYIDQPGEITGYFSRPAGAYDIVLVDPGSFVPNPAVFGRELVRFHVNPTPGRATTYAITGLTPATMRLVTVLDP